MTAFEIIRGIGTEFASVPDKTIETYIEIFRPMVSKRQFRKLYQHGIAFLAMHKLKMAGFGTNPLGEMGTIGIGFAVGSVSEGGSSVSFGANQSSNLATDAELGLTVYGVQFLSIRRMVIIPIHVQGMELFDDSVKDFSITIPIASDTELGGVKVRAGSGLILHADGTLEIDPASYEEVSSLLPPIDPSKPIPRGIYVIPNSGLTLYEDGRLEIDPATYYQVDELMDIIDPNGPSSRDVYVTERSGLILHEDGRLEIDPATYGQVDDLMDSNNALVYVNDPTSSAAAEYTAEVPPEVSAERRYVYVLKNPGLNLNSDGQLEITPATSEETSDPNEEITNG